MIRRNSKCVFLYTFLAPFLVLSQNIKGIILDSTTNLPVPFASILQTKTTIGSISNQSGEFSIMLKQSKNPEIRISSIGYKTIIQKLSFVSNKITVFLKPDEIELRQVIIIPDSLLKNILSKSFQLIPANYHKLPIELLGFYREVRKSKEKKYLYFGEANLKIQQKGYQYPEEGVQVEILKARITNFPNSDSIDNVKYYQGPFIANWGDFVRLRTSFLNPKSFNTLYTYSLESISNYNDKADTVYVISFKSKNSAERKKGKIWIDRKTFGYLKIEFENSSEYKPNFLTPVKFLLRKYQTLYSKENGKYFLKYVSMTGENFNTRTKKASIPVIEFVTTNCNVGDSIVPIPLEKRLGYLSIFSMRASNNYEDTFWDSYTSIERDASLTNQIKLHYSTQEAKLINLPESNKNVVTIGEKQERKKKILRFLQKIQVGYGINVNYYQAFTALPLRLTYQQNAVSNKKNAPDYQFFPTYFFYTGLELNQKLSIQIRSTRHLFNQNYVFNSQINFERLYLLKKMGSPLFLRATLGIAANGTGFYIGSIISDNIIELGGKNLGYQTKAYLGDRGFNGVLGFGLDYKKKRRHYFLALQYNPILWQQSALFFQTKKNIFFTEKAVVTDFSGKISVQPDNTHKGIGSFTLNIGLTL